MGDLGGIELDKVGVNLSLSLMCEGDNIGDERQVEEHVMLEHKCSRRIVAKRGIWSTSECMHGSSDCFIEDVISLVMVKGVMDEQEGANDLADDLVGGFNNGVGHRSVRTEFGRFYPRIIERELKVMAQKLRAIVLGDLLGSWITRGPMIFKKPFYLCCSWGTMKMNDFN